MIFRHRHYQQPQAYTSERFLECILPFWDRKTMELTFKLNNLCSGKLKIFFFLKIYLLTAKINAQD